MKLQHVFFVATCFGTFHGAYAEDTAPAFNATQQAEIGKIAADYLLAHPDILLQVSQKLQEQETLRQAVALTKMVLDNQEALLTDKNTPSVGPANAQVAMIEFFDYQCIYCNKMAPIVENVMKANANVKFIFKEWPIFGSRWQASTTAAQTGLSIWQDRASADYLAYHNAIYKTGHNEGALTDKDIADVLKKAGIPIPTPSELARTTATIDNINSLAHKLGLTGTPAFIIMPVSGGNINTITVVPGATDQMTLTSAINKASGH
ncbi:DsbA family protein [Brenneria goodwinii]|nr:DsbA family protein [Brenneria goodwinii]MCG8159796.1 DsbA family protein [Brenneria goodwinii]MCG8164105.1 DsbA family protein [Brenneria goodwinii]MCG8168714.1 DsbA family protein [Brenneria goodwinii]MCG8173731.1 DsbA family protein [Brenneria goodwinii]